MSPMVAMGTLLSRRQLAGAAALVLLLAGAASAAGGAERYTVNISQMRYGSLPANLNVGDTIVWVNKDTVPHTVTAKDHSFDLRLDPGKQATQTLGKAGSFAFYCIFHPTMRGTLKVAG
jgi:plastocyanin